MERNKAYELARIIVQTRLKNVSDEDRAYLNDWLDESAENRAMYKRIVRGESIARRLRMEEEISQATDYKEVEHRIVRILKNGRRRQWLRVLWWCGGAAACVAGVAFAFSWHWQPAEGLMQVEAPRVLVAALPEKEYEAVLVLGDGSTVDLYGEKPEIRQENTTVTDEKGRLVYREQEENAGEEETEVFNKVVTGSKGYALALSDGTQVWLNGNSELEYPVRFIGGKRVVALRGEAYFEVAKDAARPFIVKTEGMDTKVLGTSFNVKAYPEEHRTGVTLLEGRVEVALPEAGGVAAVAKRLEPGMQAQVVAGESVISVKEVVAEDAIAWREGKFIFTDEDMLTVLHTLARWHGVTFIREKEGKSYTFSGMFSREEQLFAVLEVLTSAGGPHFIMDGNKVYIKER